MVTEKAKETYNINIEKNPFPGLRPFSIEENHLFFGREGQSEIVLRYLTENRFAAVTGASGSGKSSLIYSGLIPLLYGGFIAKAGSNWKVIATRPGNSPVKNLANALALSKESLQANIHGIDKNYDSQITYSVLRRSSFGLVDAIRQMKISRNESVLLIIDQFEELFRFKESRTDATTLNETEAYIKLLVNAVSQTEVPVYIVITMRSDFIGECSYFHGLTRLINTSNYLVPQMTREDFKETIIGPLSVAGAIIEDQLVQHILNSIADKSDQLPVLQHAMMRTWDFWAKYNEPGTHIRIRDYETAGRIENALSMHANEAYEELSSRGKDLCKSMFKTLTEKGPDNKGIRHPAKIEDISIIANATDDEVIEVVEKFRVKGRSFVTPTENTKLDKNTVIDISHESLMRVWDKLKAWVEEESSSVQMYLRLSEAANLYQLGKTGLWRPPDLHLALNWRKSQQPTLSWAKKYNPAFEKVMVFLDASEKKFNQEEQNKIKLQRRTLNRTRRFALTLGIMSLALFGLMIYSFSLFRDAKKGQQYEAYMRDLEKVELTQEIEEKTYEAQIMEIEKLRAMNIADSAEKAKLTAFMQSLKAREEKEQALQTVVQVTEKSKILQEKSEIAEKTAQMAIVQKTEAEQESLTALRKRMLSVAQTMANKSLQEVDNEVKGLLAYQAYLFNKQFEGFDYNSDLYNSLYSSLIPFQGVNYNSLTGHEGSINSLAFYPDKSLFFSSGSDGKLLKWDLYSNSKNYWTIINNNFLNHVVKISSDSRWLACATGSSSIQLFQLTQSTLTPVTLQSHSGKVLSMDFIDNKNILISSSEDNTIIAWNLVNNTNEVIIRYNSRVRTLCITNDNKFIIGGTDDGKVIKWSIDTKKPEVLFQSDNNSILSMSLNNTGNRLAFGDKFGNLRVINLNTNSVVSSRKAHSARIVSIVHSPDSKQLATSSYDGTIKLWSANNLGINPVVIKDHESWALALAYSPDGKYLVSTTKKGMIYYWPTNMDILAIQLGSKLSRNFTTTEWSAYVGFDIDYQPTFPEKRN